MIGYLVHIFHTLKYFVKMFQKNKKLWVKTHEVYTMDASMDSIGVDDLEANMNDKTSNHESNNVLIDSAIIHIILLDGQFFTKKSLTW